MIKGNGMGTNWEGYYNVGLLDAFARGRLTRANDLSETTKLVMLMGQYMEDQLPRPLLRQGHRTCRGNSATPMTTALANHDLLVMPTLPMKATQDTAQGVSAR